MIFGGRKIALNQLIYVSSQKTYPCEGVGGAGDFKITAQKVNVFTFAKELYPVDLTPHPEWCANSTFRISILNLLTNRVHFVMSGVQAVKVVHIYLRHVEYSLLPHHVFLPASKLCQSTSNFGQQQDVFRQM